MKKNFSLKIDKKGIASLTFHSMEEANKISFTSIEELSSILDELSINASIKAMIILSEKEDVFIDGIDVRDLKKIKTQNETLNKIENVHNVLNKLLKLPFPTIASIDGLCLGEGLELALFCSYRVVTDNSKTLLGFPEATLGMVPLWGGTQRLPKLIGLRESLKMLLLGKTIQAKKAWEIGLVDAIFPREFKKEKIKDFILFCLNKKGWDKIQERRKRTGISNALLEKNPIGRLFVYRQNRKNVIKNTEDHCSAPLAILNLVQQTFTSNLERGLKKERKIASAFLCSSICKNLIDLFLSLEEIKKNTDASLQKQKTSIRATGILGSGTMGGDISWLLSRHDYSVRVKDLSWEKIMNAYEKAEELYSQSIQEKKLKEHQVKMKMHRISGCTDYSGFENLDLIIETVVEDLNVKKNVLSDLESHISPRSLICSNTSSLSIEEMSKGLRLPKRFLGMHFFRPIRQMRLVEIIPGAETSPESIEQAVLFAKQIGKIPIIVKDQPGFLVNRILFPYINESILMVEEGIEIERIDKIATDFGMPIGPIALADEIGLDIVSAVSAKLKDFYGKRIKPASAHKLLCKCENFGKKSGRGFYAYKKRSSKANPKIANILNIPKNGNLLIEDKTIMDRLLHLMINESALCLKEQIIEDAPHLDAAMVIGVGFPKFHGGILKYADSLLIANVVNKLKQLYMEYGKRFAPCDLLIEMSRKKKTFYADFENKFSESGKE